MKPLWLALPILLTPSLGLASTRICVSVQQKSWARSSDGAVGARAAPGAPAPSSTMGPEPSPPPAPPTLPALPETGPLPNADAPASPDARPARRANPHAIDPTLYLKRMLEYEVTHEPGFAATGERCEQRLTVELYPLESGWTVFARYSGTEREEKVDRAEADELGALAQRIAFALLRSRPINQTITRENVLRADSETHLRRINGTGHLIFGMGTEVRVARLATEQGASQPVATETRLLTPVSIQVGYRRKLHAWGLDAFARLNLGTENTGIHSNDLGGHIDYARSGMIGLHFLRYGDAPGVNSFYFGGGAAFELALFQAIRPINSRGSTSRADLLGGGLNLDALVGYEFLRASSVHFFGQLELDAPTYLVKSENDSGAVDTYMPGALAQIGIIF